MKRTLLTLAMLAAGLSGAAGSALAQPSAPLPLQVSAVSVPDPARQVEDLARLFRAGDLAGLAQALVPPSKWEQVRLVYELHRLEPLSEEDRAEFVELLDRFIAPDAVERLMAEIEPKLEQARPQAPGAMLMAFGAMGIAVSSPDSDLTDEQREALRAALPGIQSWASSTDFLSSERMREALTLLTDAARRTGIDDIEQIKALPLEAVLDRASIVFVAAKDAVRLYGIDLDAVADSLRVEVLDIEGETARIRTTVTLFEVPLSTEVELVLVDGRWYGKHTVDRFDVAHHGHVGD